MKEHEMSELLYRSEVYKIVGAAIEVHTILGSGFYEAVYQEAFEIELAARGITFEAQKELQVCYKGRYLEKNYVADLVIWDKIVVEIKALNLLTSREEAQLLNYLKATGFEVGVLINFGSVGKLEWMRRARTKK